MLPSALQDARDWLSRADEDAQVAELVLRAARPHLGSAAYHAQQAAEKALKGFLTAHGVPFRPTHDLVELRRQCQQFDTGFGQFVNAAQVLTPYATRFRYPGGPLHPSQLEAEQALTFAGDILRYVRQRLNV